MNLGEALNLSQQHLSQLIEFLDVNGYGQKSAAVRDAREFEERYLKYVRSRRCCMNCAHWMKCAFDAGNAGEGPVYVNGDPAESGRRCRNFMLKHDVPWKEENT